MFSSMLHRRPKYIPLLPPIARNVCILILHQNVNVSSIYGHSNSLVSFYLQPLEVAATFIAKRATGYTPEMKHRGVHSTSWHIAP